MVGTENGLIRRLSTELPRDNTNPKELKTGTQTDTVDNSHIRAVHTGQTMETTQTPNVG